MALETVWYGDGLRRVATGDIDWVNDDIRLALVTSSYAPVQDTDVDWSDITNECAGTAYTAKGKALTGQTITYDAATNRVWFNADDVSWATSTIPLARYGILHKYHATATSDLLLAWINFDTDQSSYADTFEVQFASNDALYIEATPPS